MSSIMLRPAERKKAKMRLGITAPSGAGKTYSSLVLARGIASAWEKIALIDTENGSGEMYSHLGQYQVVTLEAPYSPERYIEAIHACEQGGMEVIVIDSVSHEWDGEGGCLQIQEQLGGRYQDWAQVTPRHKKFLNAILQSPCHIVTTSRRKQDYSMVTEGSKTKVQKVGLKEVQREGFEYELTVNFEVASDSHLARASKDRTGLFADRPAFIITEETGHEILKWCESGATDPAEEQKAATIEHIRETLKALGEKATEEWLTGTYCQGAPLVSQKLYFLQSVDKQLSDLLERRKAPAPQPPTPPQTPPAAPTAPAPVPSDANVSNTPQNTGSAQNPAVQAAAEVLGGQVIEEPKIEAPTTMRHEMTCASFKGGVCDCIPTVIQ